MCYKQNYSVNIHLNLYIFEAQSLIKNSKTGRIFQIKPFESKFQSLNDIELITFEILGNEEHINIFMILTWKPDEILKKV